MSVMKQMILLACKEQREADAKICESSHGRAIVLTNGESAFTLCAKAIRSAA